MRKPKRMCRTICESFSQRRCQSEQKKIGETELWNENKLQEQILVLSKKKKTFLLFLIEDRL